ncbi:MAG TPA: hypothetical protein PK725_03645 [Rhodocyclaceae bacterium]|jgi:hypothetical protein|nr:hypothetical protein [Rhodocyclaceae bacterium]HRQ46015.1 hypothetical protein [Rhodocyclaceae bacterium]
MARSACEHALSRVLGYLRLCGVPDTREIRLAALKLVEEVTAESAEGASPEVDSAVLEQVMMRFRHRFALPATILPPVFPPLERGSIHYDDAR